ncbi:MAG: alkaline phosphatase family protein [Desulfomonile tiedjei]|nr:alkaline phosphatase family protein [Desulfomonile tiedjei]
MGHRVVAIGLDAGDSLLVQKWMAHGHLTNMRALQDRGAQCELGNVKFCSDDVSWTAFYTGCLPEQTGFWTVLKLIPGTYELDVPRYYDFTRHQPFYAQAPSCQVAVFDLPNLHVLFPEVQGVQVTGWGAHSHWDQGSSLPETLFSDLVHQFGVNPAARIQYHGLNWWNLPFLKTMRASLIEGALRRGHIGRDIMRRGPWDLFMTVFPEPHNAAHNFWHLSRADHPLHPRESPFAEDPLLECYQAVDTALGEILEVAGEDTYVVVFSLHGAAANNSDLWALLMLPEFLYRLNFPGNGLFPVGDIGEACPPIVDRLHHKLWPSDIWSRRVDGRSVAGLLRPFSDNTEFDPDERGSRSALVKGARFCLKTIEGLRRRIAKRLVDFDSGPGGWCPAMWYKFAWPRMKAFALPSFSDGFIRINLKGREPNGVVDPVDYRSVCDWLTTELRLLRNSRTGEPVVSDVWRTRSSPEQEDPCLPDADLVVVFASTPADVAESPSVGRMGPFPYPRVGGHRNTGFLLARGPGIGPGTNLPKAHIVDLAPTILTLMNAPVPQHMAGNPLFSPIR